MPAKSKVVCIPCRKVWAGGGSSNRSSRRSSWDKQIVTVAPTTGCPICKGETVTVSYRWRAPKRRNDRAWKRIADGDWLWEHDPKGRAPSNWRMRLSPAARRRDKSLTPPAWLGLD